MRAEDLSLEEKIGQMLMVGMDIDHPAECIEDLIIKHKIGGVLLYKKNYKSYEEMVELIQYIKTINKKVNKIPLFIAIDQEGGRVNRLPSDFCNLPAAYLLAQAPDAEQLVKNAATITGKILRHSGFNLNFAPDMDIKRFSDNHAIGDRAYSENKDIVAKLGIKSMKGLQEQKIVPVIKHFPGHGATKVDSHFLLPIINKSIEELKKEDMEPFKQAILNGADSILVSHLLIKGVTGNVPASMCKEMIQTLRENLKFNGLIVTDDMRMKAVSMLYGKNRAIQKAFLAGNDIIVFKYRKKDEVYQKLIQLAKKEELRGQINASVERIIKTKQKYEITDEVLNADLSLEKINKEILQIKESIKNNGHS